MKHTINLSFARTVLYSSIMAASGATAAQSSVTEPIKEVNDESNTIEEVIVSGSRFQNSLINRLPVGEQELPFAFQSLNESLIEDRGFFNPKDIIQTVPNAAVRNQQFFPGGDSYLVRGFFANLLVNNRPQSDARGAGAGIYRL